MVYLKAVSPAHPCGYILALRRHQGNVRASSQIRHLRWRHWLWEGARGSSVPSGAVIGFQMGPPRA